MGLPLAKNNEEVRSSLAQQIVHQTAFVTYPLDGDKRVVYKTIPKKTIQALILHKRYVRAGMVQPSIGTKAFVLEATFLHDGGKEHFEYRKALFEVDPIATFIIRSKANLIVSQLEQQFAEQS